MGFNFFKFSKFQFELNFSKIDKSLKFLSKSKFEPDTKSIPLSND